MIYAFNHPILRVNLISSPCLCRHRRSGGGGASPGPILYLPRNHGASQVEN